MLRLAVLLLLLANVGYYGWSSGQLAPWGLAPQPQEEPERIARQIAPQDIKVLTPDSLPARTAAPSRATSPAPAAPEPAPTPPAEAPRQAPAPTPAPEPEPAAASAPADPPQCLQAGPMDDAHAKAVRGALAALPTDSWSFETTEIPARWMVYMGRFPDEETLAKKRSELRALKVDFDRPGRAFEPGLSLGRFSSEEVAQRGLSDLAARGVRTARVVQERAPQTRQTLTLPAATSALRAQIAALAIPWGDTPLQACK